MAAGRIRTCCSDSSSCDLGLGLRIARRRRRREGITSRGRRLRRRRVPRRAVATERRTHGAAGAETGREHRAEADQRGNDPDQVAETEERRM